MKRVDIALLRRELDLSKHNCHVCGHKLDRITTREIERCLNPRCQIYLVEFTIPIKWVEKKELSA